MVLKVFKFPIENLVDGATVAIEIPVDSFLLNFEMHDGKPCLWVLAHSETPLKKRVFRVSGTGRPIECKDKKLQYVETIFEDKYLWNLLEIL